MPDGSFFAVSGISERETALAVIALNGISGNVRRKIHGYTFSAPNPIPDCCKMTASMWNSGCLSNVVEIAKKRESIYALDIGARFLNLNLQMRACDRSAASNTVDEILYCGKHTFEPNFRKLYPELCRTITNTVECAIKETEAGKPQKELYFRKWLDALHEDGLF